MDFDPDGRRLPIKVDSTSNGEYLPQPLGHAQRAANALAHERVAAAAQRRGQGRRQFLTSLGGAAATLLAFNEAHAALGATGSRYALSADAPFEPELATAELAKREFIFDVQTHCVDPAARWAKGRDGKLWQRNLFEVFGQGSVCDEGYECYSARRLLKDVYLDSDTDVAVVSALWGSQGSNPTPIDYAAEARAIIDEAQGRERCLLHGGVMPNEAGELERMQEMVDVHGVSAWKLYPQWGPDGVGFHMDDPVGITFLERARELGVKIVAAHRGLPLPGLQYEYSDPADIARVAARYPDMTFLCYHSGFEPGVTEGPYDPDNPRGVDRLIRAHQEAGFTPNQGNLYAELGGVWREHMSKPDAAAHVIGKLLKYFGEERICWGTDAIWFGSPQDQIQAFRSLRISDAFRERYGYPALSDHARARILGLNGAEVYGLDVDALTRQRHADRIGRIRDTYAQRPNPGYQTHGPKTRRDFFRLIGETGGRPG